MEPLLDTLGRPLETLRISITDRCNFRCVYCMPKEVYGRDHQFLERAELLSLEEIARVAGIFAALGVRTVRITGGEPLVRRNVEHLIELLHGSDGLEIALTTNGVAAAAEGRGARARRARPRHRQPRLGRRRGLPRAERRRLPGASTCSRASTPQPPPASASR